MSTRKLSMALFSAKAGRGESEGSPGHLHFVAGVGPGGNRYPFVWNLSPSCPWQITASPKRKTPSAANPRTKGEVIDNQQR